MTDPRNGTPSPERESLLGTELIACARSMFNRLLSHGSTGNISVRLDDRILVTPTGSSLGTVVSSELSTIGLDGRHICGPPPSKEAFLHAAMLRARPYDQAVVHTHSSHAVAVSCLDGLDVDDVLPTLTAYYAMRVGRLPLLPYHAPGDKGLEQLAEQTARGAHAMLLANHGPVVSGRSLASAMDSIEELEEGAKLFLILKGQRTSPLTTEQRRAMQAVARRAHEREGHALSPSTSARRSRRSARG